MLGELYVGTEILNEKEDVSVILKKVEDIWGERKVPQEFRYNPNFKYYAVQVNFGHLSHNKSYLRNRFMRARNIMEVMGHAKRMPRAKKHRHDVVPKVKEITYKEYLLGKLDELMDPYLRLDPKRGEKFNFDKHQCWVKNF